nr:EOG090X0C0Q [Sida crystallina]
MDTTVRHSSTPTVISQPLFTAPQCIYTSCFCEENVWHMAKNIRDKGDDSTLKQCFVVFVSNTHESIPLWKQKAGKDQDGFVVWDYHVFFLHASETRINQIYDLDSTLQFPCNFDEYARKSLRNEELMPEEFHRFFRVIPAKDFLESFSSDRRHMKKDDGTWMKPPPTYPPIQTSTTNHNLKVFVDMTNKTGPGRVMNYFEFVHKFS